MTSLEHAQRRAVIDEAISWLRTPYEHRARLKHKGVDCALLVAEVFERAGMIPHVETPFYPPDWHLHRSRPIFLDLVLRFARQVDTPQPGTVAMYRYGRCVSHGAIVISWPQIVHAHKMVGHVEFNNALEFHGLSERIAGFYDHLDWGQ